MKTTALGSQSLACNHISDKDGVLVVVESPAHAGFDVGECIGEDRKAADARLGAERSHLVTITPRAASEHHEDAK